MEPQKKTPLKDVFLRTVAVLGLIAILLLGAWGIIQLAFALPEAFTSAGSSISSLFNHGGSGSGTTTNSKATLAVSMQNSITSGQTLLVSWKLANADASGQYSYAISYACERNLTIKAPVPTGAYQTVPCNTPFNFVNASDHMNIVPVLTGNVSMPLTVTVVAIKLSTNTVVATGSATSNVAFTSAGSANSGSTQTTTASKPSTATTKPSTSYVPARTRPATLYGYGDLAVTINSVAPTVNGTTIKFTIKNEGTNVVQSGWTFNASLPINGGYAFASQPQQALYPGDKIIYNLNYGGTSSGNTYPYSTGYGYPTTGYSTSGYSCTGYVCTNNNVVTNGYPYNYGYNSGYGYNTGVVTITVDPQNFVPELNKNNNFAQTTVVMY